MLITVLLPGIIKMTLQQHQPVVPAVSVASFSLPSSCRSSRPPSGVFLTTFTPPTLWDPPQHFWLTVPWGFLRQIWAFHMVLWGWAEGAGSSRFGWREAVRRCPEHHGTQLPCAGNSLGQRAHRSSSSTSWNSWSSRIFILFLCLGNLWWKDHGQYQWRGRSWNNSCLSIWSVVIKLVNFTHFFTLQPVTRHCSA